MHELVIIRLINLSVWLFHKKDAEFEGTSFVATENIKRHDREFEHLRF